MARQYTSDTKLETQGIINVERYLKNEFQRSDVHDITCSNCNVKRNHAHIYELQSGALIKLCVFCNKKVHNVNTSNKSYLKS